MQTESSLSGLMEELRRQEAEKQDYVIDARDLILACQNNDFAIWFQNDSEQTGVSFGITETAHRQIGEVLDISAKYYDKMRYRNPRLLETNVNEWFKSNPSPKMLRTLDGSVRAFLSDRYRRIDHLDIIHHILPMLDELGDLYSVSCAVTTNGMYLKVSSEQLTADVMPGDPVQWGMPITHSEIGLGCFTIQPFIYRLVCSNGMIAGDNTASFMRKYHHGRLNTAGDDGKLYRYQDPVTDHWRLAGEIRRSLLSSIDYNRFSRLVSLMREARGASITSVHYAKLVDLIKDRYGLPKQEGTDVLQHLLTEGDFSLYGVSNAVTRTSRDADHYNRTAELERIGYLVLNMGATAWAGLNSRAS